MSQFSTPPGAYQHPQPQPLGGPPPRPGRPWWIWVLGGCGGCAVLSIIGVVVMVVLGANAVTNEMKSVGPITPQSVKQALGSDVPIYPNSQLNEPATRVMQGTMNMTGRMIGAKFRGSGAFMTADSPDKVFAFYQAKLPALGWTPAGVRNTGMQEQVIFQKGNEGLMLQVQNQNGATVYILMRGDARLISERGRGATGSSN